MSFRGSGTQRLYSQRAYDHLNRLQQLMEGLFDAQLTDFSLIDIPEYAAVVGNPPARTPGGKAREGRRSIFQYGAFG